MLNARSDNPILSNKKLPLKVIVCLVTLAAFFINIFAYDLAWADRTPLESTGVGSNRAVGPDAVKALNVSTFHLPEYLGQIKDSWKSSSQKSVVIHIQDAHCNYAAQHKISEILEYLRMEYGIETVNLEGGTGDYDLSIFTGIKDKTIRQKTADYFVKEGLVSGAEYYAINNPERVKLWGVEDANLYLDNLKVYRDSLTNKAAIDKHLNALSRILSNLKIKIYSQELLEFDSKYSQYKAGNLKFKDYLSGVLDLAGRKTIDIKQFKNIYLLHRALSDESGIDFKKANFQRDDFIDKLRKKLSRKSLEELAIKTVEFKSEKISQKEFYTYLIDKAAPSKISLDDFPDLNRYIRYISIYDAIDKENIMNEMESLESGIKEVLYTNGKERKLSDISKNLALLKNIFNISITRSDYRYYRGNARAFDVSNFVLFIQKEAPLHKIAVSLDDNIGELDRYREDIAKFFECSLKRDNAFLKNMRFESRNALRSSPQEPKKQNNPATIVITGGFHTENLSDIFRNKGISYISIMPNFKNGDGYESPYFKLLSGERCTVESNICRIAGFSLAIASILNALGDANEKTLFPVYEKWVEAMLGAKKGLIIKDSDEKVLGMVDAAGNIVTLKPGEEIGEYEIAYISEAASRQSAERDFIEGIFKQYAKGSIINIEQIKEAGLGKDKIWSIESEQGKYVLINSNIRNREDYIAWEYSLTEGLIKNGFSFVPHMYRTSDGKPFVKAGNGLYVLYEFKGGESISWGKITDSQLVNAAKTQAKYHNAVKGINPEGQDLQSLERPYMLGDLLALPEMRTWLHRARDALPDNDSNKYLKASRVFIANLPFIESQIEAIVKKAPKKGYASLPQYIIHGDFNYNNLGFNNDEVSMLIDFDYARKTCRITDIANGLIEFPDSITRAGEHSEPVDFRKLQLYLRGYQEEVTEKLTSEELDALPQAYRAWLLEGICMAVSRIMQGRPETDQDSVIQYIEANVRRLHMLERSIQSGEWQRVATEAGSYGQRKSAAFAYSASRFFSRLRAQFKILRRQANPDLRNREVEVIASDLNVPNPSTEAPQTTQSLHTVKTLLALETRLNDGDWHVRQAAATALGLAYAALVNQGKVVSLSALENLLNDTDSHVRQAATEAVGIVYIALATQGKTISLATLEAKLNDINVLVKDIAVKALSPLYEVLVRNNKMPLSTLVVKLNSDDSYVRRSAVKASSLAYAALVKQGKMSLADLESKLNDADLKSKLNDDALEAYNAAALALGLVYVDLIDQGETVSIEVLERNLWSNWVKDQAPAEALGPVYAALIRHRKISFEEVEAKLLRYSYSLAVCIATTNALSLTYADLVNQGKMPLVSLEAKLAHDNADVRKTAIRALGSAYAVLISQGEEISLSDLESKLRDDNEYVRRTAVEVLGPLYAALINQGKTVSLSALEAKLNDDWYTMRQTIAKALGLAYVALINQGKTVSLSALETMLNDNISDVNKAAAEALGSVYAALVSNGKMSLADLENKLNVAHGTAAESASRAFGSTYVALISQKIIEDGDYQKYILWSRENLLYEEGIINKYLAHPNPRHFISALTQKADSFIASGFDYNNQEEVWLAFAGVWRNGITIKFEEFKERLNELIKFDKKYPGYFNKLFSKTKGLGIITIGANESRSLDTSQIDTGILDNHLIRLQAIRDRIDNFGWITEDFPESKVFTLRNLYYQFKRAQAIKSGEFKEGERFRVEFPSENQMKLELSENKNIFYQIAFKLAQKRIMDQQIGDVCVRLMRDLIIRDALQEEGLVSQMHSGDTEVRISAFKNFYENYKNHLPDSPDSLDLKIENIEKLSQAFQELYSEVYAQIAKGRVVKTQAVDTYQLVPVGFLGVFRGRANIIDCSFDVGIRGTAFTRAMHEDTSYYFIYKGKVLKGYVGLLAGKAKNGDKILTVDTINSPSIDGEELLSSLFKELFGLAKELGCTGIALPKDMGPSFNFDNEDTIKKMSVYSEGRSVKVAPIHKQSWDNFTKMFGRDTANSIESNEFILLKIAVSSSPAEGGMARTEDVDQWIADGNIPSLVNHITRGLQGQSRDEVNKETQRIYEKLANSELKIKFIGKLKEQNRSEYRERLSGVVRSPEKTVKERIGAVKTLGAMPESGSLTTLLECLADPGVEDAILDNVIYAMYNKRNVPGFENAIVQAVKEKDNLLKTRAAPFLTLFEDSMRDEKKSGIVKHLTPRLKMLRKLGITMRLEKERAIKDATPKNPESDPMLSLINGLYPGRQLRILDIGASKADFAFWAVRLWKSRDINFTNIDIVTNSLPLTLFGQVVLPMDATNTQFEDGEIFDAIFMNYTMPRQPSMVDAILKNIKEKHLLREGGFLAFASIDEDYDKAMIKKLLENYDYFVEMYAGAEIPAGYPQSSFARHFNNGVNHGYLLIATQSHKATIVNRVIKSLPAMSEGKIDRPALIQAFMDALKDELRTIPGDRQADLIRGILMDISGRSDNIKNDLEMAFRTAIAAEGLGELNPAGLNVVAQIAPIESVTHATSAARQIDSTLMRDYNGVKAKSIIDEGSAITKENIESLVVRSVIAMNASHDSSSARTLLLLPAPSEKDLAEWRNIVENIINTKGEAGRIRYQFIEQGAMPDTVMQFELGLEILEYSRASDSAKEKGETAMPSQRFINLIAAMVAGDVDPLEVIHNKLFKTIIKIRPINWHNVEEQHRAWQAVATAL